MIEQLNFQFSPHEIPAVASTATPDGRDGDFQFSPHEIRRGDRPFRAGHQDHFQFSPHEIQDVNLKAIAEKTLLLSILSS